ncbi:sensor histidine kinase [Actinokineospora enzanensis]|uniref:sensor histidine kinase n=1 Tax=Actinokineospora enzanensis TaxID=155975 RepID=UPI000382F2B4|nr:histidine kinase [Actinokineospora enzanensis]
MGILDRLTLSALVLGRLTGDSNPHGTAPRTPAQRVWYRFATELARAGRPEPVEAEAPFDRLLNLGKTTDAVLPTNSINAAGSINAAHPTHPTGEPNPRATDGHRAAGRAWTESARADASRPDLAKAEAPAASARPRAESRAGTRTDTAETAPAPRPGPGGDRGRPGIGRDEPGCGPACGHHTTLVRLRRDLHDQVGSSLVGVAMQLEVVQQLLGADPEEATELLADVRSETSALVAQVRRFASARDEPPRPQPCGSSVATAVSTMIDRMNRVVGDRVRIELCLDREVDRVPRDRAAAAYWILREAVTNMLKHSRARHCAVSFTVAEGAIRVAVVDDGVGIPAARIPLPRRSGPAPETSGSGLVNIADRAREQGGWCRLEPREPSGLAVLAAIPLSDDPGRRP